MNLGWQEAMNDQIMEREKQGSMNIPIPYDKIVPKFCTAINIEALQNKTFVFSMIYNQNKDIVTVIERIIIDLEHAKSLNGVLTKILKDAENDGVENSL